MQNLYSDRSGAQDCRVLAERYPPLEDWEVFRGKLVRLLQKRKEDAAIKLLERFPWVVMEGTNGFGDEFQVLFASVSLDDYADNAHLPGDSNARRAAATLAKTIQEIQPGSYIRHVEYALNTSEEFELVDAPEPAFTSDTLKRLLREADRLLTAGDPVSAVDRIHTAFVSYLRLACDEKGVAYVENDRLNVLLKKLTKDHPVLSAQSHSEQIVQILRASATILDAFDPLRNRASIAHANENLLEEPEALLVANVARSLIHYLDSRLS